MYFRISEILFKVQPRDMILVVPPYGLQGTSRDGSVPLSSKRSVSFKMKKNKRKKKRSFFKNVVFKTIIFR